MKKILTYELTASVDKNIRGSADSQIISFIDPENDSRERMAKYQEIYYDFIGDNLDLEKFAGDKKATPTDILSSNFLVMNGFFISNDFAEFLKEFTICRHKYKGVYIRDLSEKKEYKFLNLIMCPNIDFQASSFFIVDEVTDHAPEEIKLSSLQDFRNNINKLHDEKGYDFTINPQKIVLKEMYDLFKYELSGKFLISEELKNALEKSGLKGYQINAFNLEVYV